MADDLDNIKINLANNDSSAKNFENPSPAPQQVQRRDIESGEPQQPRKTSWLGFLSIEFYQPYFDVTTAEVKERLLGTIDPRNNKFFEILNGKPDLYGPFWILTSLIFVLAAAGNFSGFIVASSHDQVYKSKFDFVPKATSIIYGFGLVVPIVFTALLKWVGSSSVKFIDTICIYGYSLFVLIPIFILCIIPVSIFQWVILMIGVSSSCWFLINNYAHELSKYVGNQRYMLLGFIGAAQFVLLLIFKLMFFDSIYADEDST